MPAPSPANTPASPPPSPHEAHVAQHGATGSALILGAIGIVFGDIGTSPLYTLQECLNADHGVPVKAENVFGVVSLIVWSVTMVVTVKYLAFLMRADNEGEGGIMALLALVPARLSRASVGKVGAVAALVIVGAALLFGDGIITPAISVLSAMEGLEIATVSLKRYVVPITVVILIGLFVAQRSGTGTIGKLFGPVMVVWFVTIGALGLQHIFQRPEILGALSPVHGARFFAHNGFRGFRVLGGVVLAVTGGEALYADMGHFGRKPIRAAWLGLIFPALMFCYLGQGAAILDNPKGVAQPFYALIPRGPWIFPAVILASAATVIASQALISGVFSLTHQAMRLGYFPRLLVKHTSGEAEGQIYVPLLNWGLAVACIALVLIFRESSKLAAAFGLAVSGTMAITSIVYYVVTRHTWGWSRAKALAVLVLFLSFDIPFLLANALKFFDGGYIPFLVGVAFVLVMVSWRIGRSYLGDFMNAQASPLDAFLAKVRAHVRERVPGTAIVMTANPTGVPPVLHRLVQRFQTMHEQVVLVTVQTEHVPTVSEAARATAEKLGPGLGRVTLRYGFMEVPRVPEALRGALPRLGLTVDLDQLVYILGRETLIVTEKGRMGRITEPVFALLSRNMRNATDDLGIPVAQVVELGMQVDL
jgi:KUP system potassium uptake protein